MKNQSKIGWPFVKNQLNDSDSNNDASRNILLAIFVMINAGISLFVRQAGMHVIAWSWRPAQTILTSYWFEKEGISLLHYQTPVYGPPWQIPFEFPLYQAIGTLLSRIVNDLTFACHLASIFSFYLSALFLLLICLEFLKNRLAAFIILTVYLWLPYNIFYSTEILIDYSSLAFALGFIYFLKKWLDDPRRFWLAFGAILFGCTTALVKITTLPIVIVPAVLLSIQAILRQGFQFHMLVRPPELIQHFLKNKLFWLLLICAAVLPLIAVALWTWHADKVKLAQPLAAWLSSTNLVDWNYGTLDSKTSFIKWAAWLQVIYKYFLFGGLIVFPAIGIISLYKASQETADLIGSVISSSLLTIFIFFNLYLHEYYYISISAYMSILVGYGIYYCISYLLKKKRYWWITFFTIFLVFVFMQGREQLLTLRQSDATGLLTYQTNMIPQASLVKEATPEDGFVVSVQSDWYPQFILATERKGLTFTPREINKFNCKMLTIYNFTTVVGPADSPATNAVLSCFKNQKLFAPGIYQVSN